ncbi:hypothetical protein DRJ25_05340 [Candidatus Woesearchaeota archaeon]|nr:MAG: hypothetical protein DRJ25_05340 [Candidatus Woesearchaeota archaeon]
MEKIYATLTTYEPDFQDERWGSSCIEVSSMQHKKSVKAPRSVLSDLGEKKVKKGEIVRFFPGDIGYRELRPLFE